MRLFIAGKYASGLYPGSGPYLKLNDLEKMRFGEIPDLLESYHYIGKSPRITGRLRRDGKRIFLDSGAYSAFTQGSKMDINKYCDFCHKNADIIEYCSVLDSITDPDETWRNQQIMEAQGVGALPCYHYGEPEYILEYYISRYPYITIGGMVPIDNKHLQVWLDRIWHDYLTDEQGKPKLKVHGFGMTTIPLIARYPWYSVDSSTWVQFASHGLLFTPDHGMIAISAKSPSRKIPGQHVDSLTVEQKEVVEAGIRKYGFDPERLRHLYYTRWAFNAWAFSYVAKFMDGMNLEFEAPQVGLF